MIGLFADALRPNSNASRIDGAAISQRRLMAHPHHQTQVLQVPHSRVGSGNLLPLTVPMLQGNHATLDGKQPTLLYQQVHQRFVSSLTWQEAHHDAGAYVQATIRRGLLRGLVGLQDSFRPPHKQKKVELGRLHQALQPDLNQMRRLSRWGYT